MAGITEAQLIAAGFTQAEIDQAKSSTPIPSAALEQEENLEAVHARQIAIRAMLATDPLSVKSNSYTSTNQNTLATSLAVRNAYQEGRKWANITGKPSSFPVTWSSISGNRLQPGYGISYLVTKAEAVRVSSNYSPWFYCAKSGSVSVRRSVQSGNATFRVYRNNTWALSPVFSSTSTGTSALSVSEGSFYQAYVSSGGGVIGHWVKTEILVSSGAVIVFNPNP